VSTQPPFSADKQTRHPPASAVPTTAVLLGAGGALPFMMLAVGPLLLPATLREPAHLALTTYAAVILSFLGGVHWGLTLATEDGGTTPQLYRLRLVLSVVPSLLGWGALFLPAGWDLVTLAGAFAVMLFVDLGPGAHSGAPEWYPRLRRPLSVAVITALAISALIGSLQA
jgi:hypothetical protein